MKNLKKKSGAKRDRTAVCSRSGAGPSVRFGGEALAPFARSGAKREQARGGRDNRNNSPCVRALGLSVPAVARRLGVSEAVVHDLILGPLDAWPHGPGGRELRVSPDSLAALGTVR